jgi:N-acetylglucosaminyldiphosphoundecaprenol N-acetyl-beta-D-mannosaminyltransferase
MQISNKNFNYLSMFVLGMRVDIIQIPEVISIMEEWIAQRDVCHDIVVSNANDAIFCRKDPVSKEAVNNSNLSVPDGISLVLLARLRGYSINNRVYGADLMLEFLRFSEIKNYSHFFYGSTESTLKLLRDNLAFRYPSLKISGSYAPPFKPLSREEDERVIDMINKARPDIVWVGLGCPKQQVWMHEHKDKLKVPVMVGVGAAFDFLAGVKPQAPRWIRDNGFEWLFRLVTEPKRLWRRYLISYPLFIYYLFIDFLKHRINPCKI